MYRDDSHYLSLIKNPYDYPKKEGYEKLLLKTCQVGIHIRDTIDLRNKDVQDLVVGSLFIKLLNSTYSVIMLINHQLMIDAKVVLRHELETLYRLKACLDDRGNAIDYVNCSYLERQKIGDYLLKSPHLSEEEKKQLEAIRERDAAHVSKNEIELTEIKAYEWAARSGLAGFHKTLYRDLCDSTHSGANTIDGHLVELEGEVKEINPWPFVEETPLIISTLIDILNIAFEAIEKEYAVGIGEDISEIAGQLKALVEGEKDTGFPPSRE